METKTNYSKEIRLNREGTEYLRFYDGWTDIDKVPKREISLEIFDGSSEVEFKSNGGNNFDTEEYENKLVELRDGINGFISNLNICKEQTKKYNINLSCLYKKFPGYVFWDHVAELYGYNPDLNQFMVIDDGMCWDPEGEWIVNIYRVSDNPTQKCFRDYRRDCEECLFEGRIKLIW